MERKLFEKQEKFEHINYAELNASCKLKNADGKHIVEPQRVFHDILEEINNRNIAYEMLPIVAKGGTHALYNEDLAPYVGENNIRAYTLLRTSGIITFPSFTNEETTMQLRIDVSERGITLSTGKLVLVCTNGMTAFRGDVCTTYGNTKMLYEQALNQTKSWLIQMEEKSNQYDKLISTLKKIEVDKNATETLIGKLLYQAVDANQNNSFLAPLNVTQVSAFTGAYIEKGHQEIKTGWDLYNLGTDLLKHEHMDMTIIADRNYAFSQFMLKDFGLQVEDAQIII